MASMGTPSAAGAASSSAPSAAFRHSFLGAAGPPNNELESRKLTRNASLPMRFQPPTKRRERGSGLFESSPSESDASAGEELDLEDVEQVHGGIDDGRRRTPQRAQPQRERTREGQRSRESIGVALKPSAARGGSWATSGPERKGLFEGGGEEDDAVSVESLRERVKQRQKRKESEILSLKAELDDALAKISEIEASLAQERKAREECSIRMDECQRIIEKRNRQLIKASERMARLAEQNDAQVKESNQRIEEQRQELERVRAEASQQQEKLRAMYEAKLDEQRRHMESRIERITQSASDSLREKDQTQGMLEKRVAELEREVITVTSRIAESDDKLSLQICNSALQHVHLSLSQRKRVGLFALHSFAKHFSVFTEDSSIAL
ncbi:hypothetical protein ATCC90586_000690 [Pythium insidiosum]|nr:hypothetical protein ATCC90586_000690 [Pythium insidiosum]